MNDNGRTKPMNYITAVITTVDRLGQRYLPPDYLPNRWVEMAMASVLLAVIILLFVKWFGLCGQLRAVRRKLMALAYKLLLYRRRPRIVVATQCRLLWMNAQYLVLLLPTIIFSSVVVLLAYHTLVNRYAFGPASVGKDIVVRVRDLSSSPSISDKPGLTLDTTAIRTMATVDVPAAKSRWYRLRPLVAGTHQLQGDSWKASLHVETEGEACPRLQMAGNTEVWIVYPPDPSGSLIGTWWFYMTGVGLLAAVWGGHVLHLKL